MKKVILIVLLLFPMITQSQEIKNIEPAIMEIVYQKRKVTDTLDRNNDVYIHPMTLRIAQETSMFFSQGDMLYDSLSVNWALKSKLMAEVREKTNGKESLGGNERERVYKNYPEGKVTVYNHFSLMHWKYTEDWEKPEWTLIDSAKTILGYKCQLAQSNYRGRTWYAWFTLDIPISEGPWKLCGLPGMILEAYDLRKDYIFTAQEIRTQNLMPVGIYNYSNYDWAVTKHKTYYKTWYEALHEDLGYKIFSSGAYGLKPTVLKAPRKLPHRNYDFEETDYHNESNH